MLQDPTASVDLDLGRYVAQREARIGAHMVGGVPDYAFHLDWQIRRKLDAVPAMRMLVQTLLAGTSAVKRAVYEMQGVAVGPDQLPHLHAMGVACAERLGISVPQIYVVNKTDINAYTFATGETDPIIVVHSALLHAMDDDEVNAVIGHECGHIHNRHGVYNALWELLGNTAVTPLLFKALSWLGPPGWILRLVLQAFQGGTRMLFQRWHRCAEITCDRAGLICSEDLDAAIRVDGKLALGNVGSVEGFDVDVFAEQMQIRERSKLAWLREINLSHPPGALRARAAKLFRDSDVLRTWRPELVFDGDPRPKDEIDAEIAGFIL